ncbi:hypothetical protein PQX77_005250 [Marasmius sp. AFHP31]|nr:hypothetical protein PQX77_005250 [Marasmius sp. AFHP31]
MTPSQTSNAHITARGSSRKRTYSTDSMYTESQVGLREHMKKEDARNKVGQGMKVSRSTRKVLSRRLGPDSIMSLSIRRPEDIVNGPHVWEIPSPPQIEQETNGEEVMRTVQPVRLGHMLFTETGCQTEPTAQNRTEEAPLRFQSPESMIPSGEFVELSVPTRQNSEESRMDEEPLFTQPEASWSSPVQETPASDSSSRPPVRRLTKSQTHSLSAIIYKSLRNFQKERTNGPRTEEDVLSALPNASTEEDTVVATQLEEGHTMDTVWLGDVLYAASESMQQVLSHATIDSTPNQYPSESLPSEFSDAALNPFADAEGSWDYDLIAQLLDGVFPPSDIETILANMPAANSTSSPSASSSSRELHTLLTDSLSLDIPFVPSEPSPQPSDSELMERKERCMSAKVKAATVTASHRKRTAAPAPKRVKAKATGTGNVGMGREKGRNMDILRQDLIDDSDLSCFSDGSTHGDDSDYAPSSSRPSPRRAVFRKRRARAASSTSVSPSSESGLQTQWVGNEMEHSSPRKVATNTNKNLSASGIGSSSASRNNSTGQGTSSSPPSAHSPGSVAKKKKALPKGDHAYGCPLSTPENPCYQRFTRLGDARRHARTAKAHSEKMFYCELCEESFGREYSLERHIKTSDKHARKVRELELAESSED